MNASVSVFKEGTLEVFEKGRVKSKWRTRFVVLDGNELEIFKDNSKGKLKAKMTITSATKSKAVTIKKMFNPFQVVTGKQKFVIEADDPSDRSTWLSKVEKAVSQADFNEITKVPDAMNYDDETSSSFEEFPLR